MRITQELLQAALKEHMRKLASKGGSRQTPAQKRAAMANIAKANKSNSSLVEKRCRAAIKERAKGSK